MDPTPPDIDALAARCDQSPPEQAVAIASVFTAQHPEQPFGWTMLAESHYRAGDYESAATAAEQSARLNPDSASAHSNLGVMLKKLGRFNEAEAALRRALQCDPDFAAAYVNLGTLLCERQRLPEAEALSRRALTLNPSLVEPRNNLANLLRKSGRLREAASVYRELIALAPDHVTAHANFASLLLDLDCIDEAESVARRALAIDPTNAHAYGSLLYLLAYAGRSSGPAMRMTAQQWNSAALNDDSITRGGQIQFQRREGNGRPLRVGILSAELGAHVVAHFLSSWVWKIDPSRIELRFYPTKFQHDEHGRNFEQKAQVWVPLVGLNDAQAAERLRADELDLLIETSGYTADNRLGVVAQRVAPVQCHYIGYFASTGLAQLDYFIADSVLIPVEHDTHFCEKVWRLPRTRYAYDPMNQAPQARWLTDPNDRLWLGSFNNLAKVREQSLELWAKVLNALPNAMLLLKDLRATDALVQARVLNVLEQFGVKRERVAFCEQQPSWDGHMHLYNHVDIALDTLPFNSATTACEALWMGTPLITLIGDQAAGRQAASILTGLGRPDWIARTPDEFVKIAVDLADDVHERQRIRETQRDQMKASELCDGFGLARALEDAFLQMFRHWEAGVLRK